MNPLQQEFEVAFRYAVHFTTGLFSPGNPLLRQVAEANKTERPARLLFVLDAGVVAHHPDLPRAIETYCAAHAEALALAGPPLALPGGEAVKNDPAHLAALHRAIHEARLCRQSYVVAVGGGALLDVAGYAAATAHRGIRLLRAPTTTLSQADSGVGVKNSLNAFGKKNYLGTFAPPFAVLNDAEFLTTLDDRDWRGGSAEAIKVALVKDRAFFSDLEEIVPRLAERDLEAMRGVIRRSAALHLEHIATGGDPFEQGSARPLDFGHWAAHRLEDLTEYRLRHGEAVAIGLALDTTYSFLAGFLPEAEWRRALALLAAAGFALAAPELKERLDDPRHPRSLLRGLEEFREHLGGPLTITLLRRIGEGFETHEIDAALVRESVRRLLAWGRV